MAGNTTNRRSVAEVSREVLVLCASADAVAREAAGLPLDADLRLHALLEQRESIMQDMAEQLFLLQHERPTADSAMFAATEQLVDEADDLIAEVCSALEHSHQMTRLLAARVARRVDEIRSELDAVQRSAAAAFRYGTAQSGRMVDRVR